MRRISLGAGHIGGDADEGAVLRLLDRALELGIDLIDTARSYGSSEERIGRWLERNRGRVRISTKIGYGVDGHEDWTGPCISAGIDRALRMLRTERIDLVHLHSCPIEILKRPEITRALEDAVRAGKVGTPAYSGDGAALEHALEMGSFGALQATLNVCDRANARVLEEAKRRGIVTIAKRPLANAPWRFASRPDAHDLAVYFDRWRTPEIEMDPMELCVRFAAHHPGVDTILIGTGRIPHLESAVAAVEKGPLPDDVIERLHWDPSWPPIT
jgi:aryl-alcohol dehydrogenase-like predicted oxidoreductase